jgi:hypothetical protein
VDFRQSFLLICSARLSGLAPSIKLYALKPQNQKKTATLMDPSLLVPLFATLLCYVLFHLGRMVYKELTSSIRHFPGPKNHSWIVGNFFDMTVIAPEILRRIHELMCPVG